MLVVGNAGMAGRKEFLLGNVPNRISHNARCTVIIVNTTDGVTTAMPGASPGGVALRAGASIPETQPHLIARGSKIATVFAKHGLKELFGRPDEEGTVGRARRRSGCARRSRSSARRSASSGRSCRPVPTCSRRSSSTSSRSSKTTCRRCPRSRSSA